MTTKEAQELAGACWADPRTERLVMIPELAEVFAERLKKVAGSRDDLVAACEAAHEIIGGWSAHLMGIDVLTDDAKAARDGYVQVHRALKAALSKARGEG